MFNKHQLSIRNIIPLVFLLWTPLLTSCSNPDQDLPLEQVSLSKYACADDIIHIPRLPAGIDNETEAKALTGGTVRSGDFLLSLWLFCDPTLTSDDPLNDDYSEVKNLAFLSAFRYFGEPLDQPINLNLTVNSETFNSFAYSASTNDQILILRGATGANYGRIITNDQTVAHSLITGEPVIFLFTVSTSELLASAQLIASFEETPDGYHLLNAEIINKK